jgi:hypothetical protein
MQRHLLAVAWLIPSLAVADTIGDVKPPAKERAIQSWTPVEQYMPADPRGNSARSEYGYGNNASMLLLADELGDKLSELGRASMVDVCFKNQDANTSSTLLWAMCGSDARAIDETKLAAELDRANISPESKASVVKHVAAVKAHALQIGEAIETEAKSDPGLAQILKLADAAKAEWGTYIDKNKDAYARYLALKDAVRGGKTMHAAFTGCHEATQPPFAKLVKTTAAKIDLTVGNDALVDYASYMTETVDGYVTTVAYAACAWSHHPSGEAMLTAAANRRRIRAGWRTIALAKLLDRGFQPKFADRKLSLDNWISPWKYTASIYGANARTAELPPSQGVIEKLEADGEVTRVKFKNDDDVVEVATRYIAGVKRDDTLVTIGKFPVEASRKDKRTLLLGVALK